MHGFVYKAVAPLALGNAIFLQGSLCVIYLFILCMRYVNQINISKIYICEIY